MLQVDAEPIHPFATANGTDIDAPSRHFPGLKPILILARDPPDESGGFHRAVRRGWKPMPDTKPTRKDESRLFPFGFSWRLSPAGCRLFLCKLRETLEDQHGQV